MAASSAVGTSSVRIFLSTFRRPSRIRYGGAGNLIYRILPPPRGRRPGVSLINVADPSGDSSHVGITNVKRAAAPAPSTSTAKEKKFSSPEGMGSGKSADWHRFIVSLALPFATPLRCSFGSEKRRQAYRRP